MNILDRSSSDIPSPVITAYRGDEETWRLERLRKLRLYGVLGLHDHKGCLSVNWPYYPAKVQLNEVRLAWEKEGEHEIIHYIQGKPIWDEVAPWANPFGGGE